MILRLDRANRGNQSDERDCRTCHESPLYRGRARRAAIAASDAPASTPLASSPIVSIGRKPCENATMPASATIRRITGAGTKEF